ncbi:ATP-dependent helicase HrpB [Henriciella barbarensis]|uniref:ATP-dependent helicase HrpB n=1 Tax=Henriciella barbarensis TaxID=86342 RepID=A0A399R1F3_9PROT|nr:ATP-dependent helicase HrpB [Henriciella barbarensis]RIJ24314.1 ATP-dependent helicase HrpB [Henriciella barbarensis]
MSDPAALPIESLLGEICSVLRERKRLVLAAPPGAGKTTRVPLALAGLIDGFDTLPSKIMLLEPRRLAARMAADRMAATLGEKTGGRIGLSTRIERKVSKATQVEVMTDGLFTRRLLADPGLEGVSAVIFDEIHERSLNADLGLALALEAQSVFRDDLLLLAMSATLETKKVAGTLNAPVIESGGRQFPVETKYLGRTRARIEDQMASAITKAVQAEDGSILAFLPGAGEIRRTAERLSSLPANVSVHPLYGALSPREQDEAVRPARAGHRKVVLATDIAESALTIEGVHVVVDAGLARVPEFEPASGTQVLRTIRAAKANVDQRRGRAGRLGPGVCYRLWDEEETRGLIAAPRPEILNGDLSSLLLSIAEWGEDDPYRLTWLDAPPGGRIEAAREALIAFGALDEAGKLTAHGKAMAALPLDPKYASLVASADTKGERALAAEIAALASEAGVGGNSANLVDRLVGFRKENSPRAKALKRQAERWANGAAPSGDAALLLAKAWPGQIARRRDGSETSYLLANGRAGEVETSSPLARALWIVVADMIGAAGRARITLAAPINEADVVALHPPVIEEWASFDPASHGFKARRVKAIGRIVMSETPLPQPSGEAARVAFVDFVRENGFESAGIGEPVRVFLARLSFLHRAYGEDWPDLDEALLAATAEEWLAPALGGGRFDMPSDGAVLNALKQSLGWPKAQEIDTLAPMSVTLPSGRNAPVDYLDDNAPLVEAKAQELFGLSRQPAIADARVPVTLQLISPAGRPIAVTKDISGFWNGGYRDMAKDMRAQYPKHDWPDDPAAAKPHVGMTKKRLGSQG